MLIKIDSKEFEKEKMELLDSIDHFSWQEFDYFTENLYISENGDYILETLWKLSPEWHKNDIEAGTLTEKDLEEKTEYRLMSVDEGNAWLDDSIWEV